MPSEYLIRPDDDQLYCTQEETIKYQIGCAASSNYTECIRMDNPEGTHIYEGMTAGYDSIANRDVWTKTLHFRVDGRDDETTQSEMSCISPEPQTGENTSISNCTVSLPTGKELALRT